jgi:hypothetical protein
MPGKLKGRATLDELQRRLFDGHANRIESSYHETERTYFSETRSCPLLALGSLAPGEAMSLR